MSDEGYDDRDYQSGPFCQHWSDPSDCDHVCTCAHKCSRHNGSEDCNDCPCENSSKLRTVHERVFG